MRIETLYLDMDGVVADFDRNLLNFGVTDNRHDFIHRPKETWTEVEVDLDRRVCEAMAHRDFWWSIPPMQDAYDLWGFTRHLNVAFLTAAPRMPDHRQRVTDEKRAWVQSKFGPFPKERIHVCLRSEKKHLAAPGRVLVDDMPINCEEWRAAGGVAIRHINAEDTINQIKELMYDAW